MFIKNNNTNIDTKKSFIFYDYETFGLNISLDKVAQFCSIETDHEFKVIRKKTVLFCYPPIDYLPDPNAVLITKILPQYTQKYGLNEYFFAKRIYDIFSQKNSCIVGFNNINFDNLITRNIFYRNLLDPYEWSWKNGNFSWDILNILRAFYIFYPNTMIWYRKVNGSVSFKLSDITFINNIVHIDAHDAYSDVIATFTVARYLYKKNKKFFLYLYKISHKKHIIYFISQNYNRPFFYLSSFFGSQNNNLGCILIIGTHPKYTNNLIVINLSINIKKIFHLYSLSNNIMLTVRQLFDCGIHIIYINKSPLFFSYNSLSLQDCQRLNINYKRCQKNFFLLKNNILLKNWILSIFLLNKKNEVCNDVDLLLYKNFFNSLDKLSFSFIHTHIPVQWIHWCPKFIDTRIEEIFFRLKARNFISLLNFDEMKRWQLHCQNKINNTYIKEYVRQIKCLQNKYYLNKKKFFLLEKLIIYMNQIIYNINNLI
ncbi:Exodeoxyribonuclease I [Buchnera aphidicola (Cinara kochiana kochiana)]|uniref:Exodeoxyribonuclease I n=1 Tax=Buchnera aphidicola (Cinara kochiana kochiana) TaxID=2518976 RepID=A0A451D5Y8_9GAMM|nr:exodeoxyribonuclease I [Buchnera aphidicola]VFP81271.1 Exodeoxyribonuclease I [Buchnera aphidicola (Cinara kochiana kochiana)]